MGNNDAKDKEILRLKEELNKANKIINEQKLKIQNLEMQLNTMSSKYNKGAQLYQTNVYPKSQELSNVRLPLQHSNSLNSPYVNRSKMMAVNFISMDSRIHFAVPCIGQETFAEVEERLYKQFPEYRETNNTFLANGRPVLRFKTIIQNNIGTGLPVTLVLP